MELRHLKYFIAVAEELNFTRAAERMYTAQPSLSQQIKDLESEVGLTLIDRSTRRISLTPEGEVFLIHAREALSSANRAISAARQLAKNKKNQFYIGFLNVAEIKIMPLIIDKIKKNIQDININIQSLTCTEQISRLKNSELDVTFTRYLLDDAEFESQLILSEKIYLVCSKNILPGRANVSNNFLSSENLIMCDQNASPIFFEKIERMLDSQKITPKSTLWATNVLQHINLINMGFGWSFIPEYALKFLNEDIKIVKPDFDTEFLNLYMNFKKNHNSQAIDLILKELNLMKSFYL